MKQSKWSQRDWDQPSRLKRLLRPVTRHIGLGGKLTLASGAVLVLTVSLCGVGIRWEAGRQLDHMLQQQAEASARSIADAAAVPLARDNKTRLTEIMQNVIRNAGVNFVQVINTDEQPIVGAPAEALAENVKVERAPIFAGDVHEDGSPKVLGFVVIGLDTAVAQTVLENVELHLLQIGSLCCLIGQVLISLFVRQISRPLRQFERASRRIAVGEEVGAIDLDRTDVLGDLGRSFRHMADQIERQREDVQQANEKLAQINRELESRIAFRTTQLEAANMRLGGEIAEKEDFLRAVSHDLNAPLRNIGGMVTMLRRKHGDELSDEALRRLDRIEKNIQHETDLISELLELSRIKTRRTSFDEMELVDLERMVWDLRGLFESDLREKHIELSLATTLPKVRCEKARFRQVLQNLVDNAIKYMGDGAENHDGVREKKITVGCKVRPSEAEFFVRDTGQGIDPADLDKVFYVFRRGKNHGTAAGKGVGLASVKSIVETYNGTIWAESELGKGTTFRFTINARFIGLNATVPEASKPTVAGQGADVRGIQGDVESAGEGGAAVKPAPARADAA